MNAEISDMVSQCDACQKHQPSQLVEPLNPHEIPVRAWQRVGVDIGTISGKEYLIVCDYYSGYPEVVTYNHHHKQSCDQCHKIRVCQMWLYQTTDHSLQAKNLQASLKIGDLNIRPQAHTTL